MPLQQALDAWRAGSVEAALEAAETASLALARAYAERERIAPLAIHALHFVAPDGTNETALAPGEATAGSGELHLRVEISGLTREERRGRFRHHLRHTLRIVNAAGTTLLEETPVDRLGEFGPVVTRLHVIDRIPLAPEWGPGSYTAVAVAEDLLAGDPAAARAESAIPFTLLPPAGGAE